MTNIYLENGSRVAATRCRVSPLIVTQVKTTEKDGYQSIQVAYGNRKRQDQSTSRKLNKLSLSLTPKGFKEFTRATDDPLNVGDSIEIDKVLQPGDSIAVTATSKGHGFAGVIKRWGFQRQPVTGGQSDRVRAPGSIGAQTPGKVVKGKKMPGHYGNVTKTIKGLKILKVDLTSKEILISGPVPGHLGSWLVVTKL